MSAILDRADPKVSLSSPAGTDALVAAGAALVFLAACLAGGFSVIEDGRGDNDSLMRLVQVRDLLAGQGWFDLMQYRMGPAGGIEMHWSRLADLPVALLILLFEAILGEGALAERLALNVWPVALYGAALFLLIRLARALGGEWAVLPAAMTGALALHFVGIFVPGAIDHHNLQLVLVLATVLLLARSESRPWAPALAGLCAAAMLAIAMEAAPYVAAAGAVAAAGLLAGGSAGRNGAAGFGTAFAGTAALVFLATVPPAAWMAARCDAYSLPQVSVAITGGGGLAALAFAGPLNRTMAGRAAGLAALALALAALVLWAFPQCLDDPYAAVDPRLRRYWLDSISEVQSAVALLGDLPRFLAYYATPAVGLAALAWRVRHGRDARTAYVLAAFLGTAFLVSLWQVRGAMFALPLATAALAAMIASARRRAERVPATGNRLAMVAAWLVSFNIVWQFAATSLVEAAGDPPSKGAAAAGAARCYAAEDFRPLAALAPERTLAVSNLGSAILRFTPHSVLAASYHRNAAGNLAALDIWMAEPARARALLRASGIGLVAHCPGNDETGALADWAPGSLIDRLQEGSPPEWLRPVPEASSEALAVFRVL